MSNNQAATKQDIDNIVDLIGDLMHHINDRFDRIEKRFDRLESRASLHGTVLAGHELRLKQIEKVGREEPNQQIIDSVKHKWYK